MQVIYAGQVIAQEPSEGGLDAVQDFMAGGGKQVTQASMPTRGENAIWYGRGNRKRTITGSVILSSQADLKTAMRLRGMFYDTLPDSGDLLLQVEGEINTYAGALLESCEVVKNQQGVSVGFKFTFIPQGPPVPSTVLLNKLGGTELLNKDGVTPLSNKTT